MDFPLFLMNFYVNVFKAAPFIKLVCDEIRNNPLSFIDETIHDLILNKPSSIVGMTTVSTKAFYNYVHVGLIDIKPIDLPRTVQRKKKPLYKTYIPKRQKGTSIDERPAYIHDRLTSIFHTFDIHFYLSFQFLLAIQEL